MISTQLQWFPKFILYYKWENKLTTRPFNDLALIFIVTWKYIDAFIHFLKTCNHQSKYEKDIGLDFQEKTLSINKTCQTVRRCDAGLITWDSVETIFSFIY